MRNGLLNTIRGHLDNLAGRFRKKQPEVPKVLRDFDVQKAMAEAQKGTAKLPESRRPKGTNFFDGSPRRRARAVRTFGSDKARVIDRSAFDSGTKVKTRDGSIYMVHSSGAFIKLNKDRRSPKVRKRERREARENQG